MLHRVDIHYVYMILFFLELGMAVNVNNHRGNATMTNIMFLDSCYTKENETTIDKLWKVRKKLTENVFNILDNRYDIHLNKRLSKVYNNLSDIEYIIKENYDKEKDILGEVMYCFLIISGVDIVKRLYSVNMGEDMKNQINKKYQDIENIRRN